MKSLYALAGAISLALIALASSDGMETCMQRHSAAVCQHTLNR